MEQYQAAQSLLVAMREIADNSSISSTAVTATPNTPEGKIKDIARALKVYSAFHSLEGGKLPSNQQITSLLSYSLSHPPFDIRKLSDEGRVIVNDVQSIIRTISRIIEEKNTDEVIQDFLHTTQSRGVDVGINAVTTKIIKHITGSVTIKYIQDDKAEAIKQLQTLGRLIMSNSEFRKLLKDVALLGRDVAADAAVKLASTLRPDEEELARADEPAPSNQWESNETVAAPPAVEVVKADESTVDHHAEAIFNQDQANGDGGEISKHEKLRKRISSKITEKKKQEAKQQYENVKLYVKDKFPVDRRNRFIFRLKKVVVESQKHRDYQNSIEYFLDKIENYASMARETSTKVGEDAETFETDTTYVTAEHQLRTILERFANGESMQPIFDAVKKLVEDSKADTELREFFSEVNQFVRRALQEAGYIMTDAADRQVHRLENRAEQFFDPKKGKYASHKDAIFNSIGKFAQAFAQDTTNVQLGDDIKKLFKDLLVDSDGKITSKQPLWNDIRSVIIPSLFEEIGNIPIPRMEYTSPKLDFVAENLTLELVNLIPNIIETDLQNYIKLSPYDAIKDRHQHDFKVSFSQVQANLKDVAFFVHKKQGYVQVTEQGTCDVFIGGRGISGTIHVRKTDHFQIVSVDIKVHTLKLKIRSGRGTLIKIIKPFIMGLIKKKIAKALADILHDKLNVIGKSLDVINKNLNATKDDEHRTSFNVIWDLLMKKADKTKPKKKPAKRFKITTKAGSELIDWTSAHSMLEQEKEIDEKAVKDFQVKGWRSAAFNLDSGPPATPSKA